MVNDFGALVFFRRGALEGWLLGGGSRDGAGMDGWIAHWIMECLIVWGWGFERWRCNGWMDAWLFGGGDVYGASPPPPSLLCTLLVISKRREFCLGTAIGAASAVVYNNSQLGGGSLVQRWPIYLQ